MGDVVFAPMYLALRNRGVKFRFFHRLDEIELGGDGTAVTRLKFRRQVTTQGHRRSGADQLRAVDVIRGDSMPGWPEKPDHEQFDYDEATLRRSTCEP